MSFLQENKNKVMSALKYPEDKGMICIAMVNSAYPFCYDVTTVLGRYFHAQKEVATTLLAENGGYPPTQNGDIRSLFWLFSLMALQN